MKPSSKGLTLIEVLISIVILAIVMTAGMAFYFHSDSIIGLVTHKKMATEIAGSIMEDLKRAGYGSLASSGPAALATTDDPTGVVKDLSATKTVVVTDIGSPVAYKQVDVTIAWTEVGGGARRTRLTTYIAP